jgi:hypothetical protein
MKQFITLILICAVYSGLISPTILQIRAQVIRGKSTSLNMLETSQNGLKFRLSEGAAGAENRTTTPPNAGEALSENQTSNLLKRLPEVNTDKNDQVDFAKRAGSLPPPKTGKTVNVKFPADDERGTPKVNIGNTLEVVRFAPEGAVNLAPDLSVTFSQKDRFRRVSAAILHGFHLSGLYFCAGCKFRSGKNFAGKRFSQFRRSHWNSRLMSEPPA